jgi:hypothetical protein
MLELLIKPATWVIASGKLPTISSISIALSMEFFLVRESSTVKPLLRA